MDCESFVKAIVSTPVKASENSATTSPFGTAHTVMPPSFRNAATFCESALNATLITS